MYYGWGHIPSGQNDVWDERLEIWLVVVERGMTLKCDVTVMSLNDGGERLQEVVVFIPIHFADFLYKMNP